MVEVADNVRRLGWFPRYSFNAYLVGDVLFDACTRHESRYFIRVLRGISLKLIALTHVHPDHQGAVAALRKVTQCAIACHEADALAMEGCEAMGPPNWPIRPLSNLFAGPRCPVDRLLREGDEVGGFRVYHAPGHTKGHVIYFRASDRVAIAGDLATSMNFFPWRNELHEPPRMFCEDWRVNRDSIRKLIELRPKTVLFGHGPPVRDVRLLREFAERIGAIESGARCETGDGD